MPGEKVASVKEEQKIVVVKDLLFGEKFPAFRKPKIEKPTFVEPSSAIVGIEIEVENLNNGDITFMFWEDKADGSLRNAGKEFVSIPLRSWEIDPALKEVKEKLDYYWEYARAMPDFSWRTSTHVHLNVRDYTVAQVGAMGLLEVLFSRVWFNFISRNREKSNFCVPNSNRRAARQFVWEMLRTHPALDKEKDYPHVDSVHQYMTGLSKYSSLNFLPMNKFGTIEFRQFHGADDPEKFRFWVDIITRLHDYVTAPEFDLPELVSKIRKLNTISNYIELTDEVFTYPISRALQEHTNPWFDDYMKHGCWRAKQCLFLGGDQPRGRYAFASTSFIGGVEFFKKHKEKVKPNKFNWASANYNEEPQQIVGGGAMEHLRQEMFRNQQMAAQAAPPQFGLNDVLGAQILQEAPAPQRARPGAPVNEPAIALNPNAAYRTFALFTAINENGNVPIQTINNGEFGGVHVRIPKNVVCIDQQGLRYFAPDPLPAAGRHFTPEQLKWLKFSCEVRSTIRLRYQHIWSSCNFNHPAWNQRRQDTLDSLNHRWLELRNLINEEREAGHAGDQAYIQILRDKKDYIGELYTQLASEKAAIQTADEQQNRAFLPPTTYNYDAERMI